MNALTPFTRTYGALALTGDTWVLGGVEPHVIIRLKQLFPQIPKAATNPFRFVNDPGRCADLAWFIDRYPMGMTPEDRRVLERGRERYTAFQAEMERIQLPDYQPPAYAGVREGQAVRRYQGQAVETLIRSKGLLLGDDVGLGKTFTAAAAALAEGALPAAVVCQPHLQDQWAKVILAFTTLTVHQIKGTRPYALPPADVYVFRYTQLMGWVDMFPVLKVRLAIYDEVQELRTGTGTAKGSAAKRLTDLADYRLGLSATPIYNYGAEVFQVMEFISPGILGSWDDFAREWCRAIGNGKYRLVDPAALGTYLREQRVFLRRTKHDVGQEMPAVNRVTERVEHDAAAVRAIEERAVALAIKATTGGFSERGQAARDLDIMVRQKTGVAKARHVADFVRILVEAGEPIVLVGWHREVYEIWLERLADLKPAMYTGSETASQKDREKARFLDGETQVMIMSLRSGAGLDGLQYRCSTMVFGELDWSPGVHHQCIGRLDREGQADPVTAVFLVADEGSDPPMIDVLGLKATEAQKVVDPGLGLQVAEADTSKLAGLVQRYLKKRGRG